MIDVDNEMNRSHGIIAEYRPAVPPTFKSLAILDQRVEIEKPVLKTFWEWIAKNQGRILPKSALSATMAYALNLKKGLDVY